MAANTIVLKGELGERHEEYRASGVCKPGHLLMIDSDNKVKKHNVYGGKSRLFAKEDALQGKTVTDEYAIGDLVPVHSCKVNDKIQTRVPANAAAIVVGDFLISNGDGCVVKGLATSSVLYSNTAASAAVSNTTTETAFDKTYTFAANQLKAGDVIKISGQVIATATNSTDTLTIKVYIGGLAGTAIVSSGALDVANNDVCVFDITLVIRTVGASGTLVAAGFITIGAPGTSTVKSFNLGSTTIDTTTTKQIAVSAQWSVANAGNSARLDVLTVGQERSGSAGSGETIGIAAEALDNSAVAAEAFLAAWMV